MGEGRSEEKTDILGNKYIQYYDRSGNKSGTSELKTDIFGKEYVQHYNSVGDKSGTSESKTDIFGNDYTLHRDNNYSKSGTTESKTDILGNVYDQHRDGDYNKTGWSEERTDILGSSYTKHHGSGGLKSGPDKFHDYSDDSSLPHSENNRQSYSSESSSRNQYSGGGGSSSSSYGSYECTGGSSDFGWFLKFIIGALGLVLLLSMATTKCSNKLTAPTQQQVNQNSYQPAKKAKKARKHEATNPPMQEEAPRQEAVQPPTEKVEHARTVHEFRVPMNPSIAAANEFTAEVRFPDGRTESAAITGLTKGNETLYVALGQDYPEGTVVTIYPKIEYSNRFVVPGNPGILTSPGVNVTVQLPDGRSFQPCVQNIERGMTQLLVTTCDNYPTGTTVIVNPVYGNYRY